MLQSINSQQTMIVIFFSAELKPSVVKIKDLVRRFPIAVLAVFTRTVVGASEWKNMQYFIFVSNNFQVIK